jgi:ABC-2 type transport system ATP-binding protein
MPDRPVAASSPAVAALEWRGVVKDFAIGLRGVRLRALDGLDLRVAPGQIHGLLGPNGSGKSTSIKLILGLLRPTAGQCFIFGVSSERVEARRAIGYVPESPNFYRHLTGRELVRFYARLSGVPATRLEAGIGDALAAVGLGDVGGRRVGTYSKGMLQRLGLAQALVHDPQILILDEPTSGVDPAGAAAMCELILRCKADGRTVLITSHLPGQIEDVCDCVAILDRGRLVAEGSVEELAGRGDRQTLVTEPLAENELDDLRAWFAVRGKTLESIGSPRDRLERIYLERVGRETES